MTLLETRQRGRPTAGPSAAQAATALRSLPIGILISTAKGTSANPELHRIWCRPGDEPFTNSDVHAQLEPLDFGPLASAATRTDAASVLDRALRGERTDDRRHRLRSDDGSESIVRVWAAPLADDDGEPGAVLALIDDTSRYQTERVRDAFLGILGHELRTPITSIVGGAELLQSDGLDPDTHREVAAALVAEADRLHLLVEQLLHLASLERRGAAPEPLHVAHLVRRVARAERARLPRLKLDVRIEGKEHSVALGDAGFVDQVLRILLDNAVKYAGADGSLVLRVHTTDQEVAVHVLDDGPGLPPGGDAIFRLYQRGAGRDEAGAGSGIGLFVARAIIEAMGGRTWAEGRVPRGADVGFALPAAFD
jgi:signal transduction histidine kinase